MSPFPASWRHHVPFGLMGVAVCGNLSVWHGYRWWSAAGHVSGRADALVKPGGPLAAEVSDWRRFLAAAEEEEHVERLRPHLRTGRPLGDPAFIARLETRLDRRLHRLKPGPKPKPKT